jgi:hypothetical protein
MPGKRNIRYGRLSKLSFLFVLSLVLGGQPAFAINLGEGLIRCGTPTMDGLLDVTIKCKNADTTIETIYVSVAISSGDDAIGKALSIQATIDAQNPDCLSTSRTANQISLIPCASCSVQSIEIENDSTGGTSAITINPKADDQVKGEIWLQGAPTPGGVTNVSVGGLTFDHTSAPLMTTQDIMMGLTSLIMSDISAGVDATFDGGKINIWNDLRNVELGAGNDDPGLELNQSVVVSTGAVPAISGWGLVLLAVFLLAGAVLVLADRKERLQGLSHVR